MVIVQGSQVLVEVGALHVSDTRLGNYHHNNLLGQLTARKCSTVSLRQFRKKVN
jgi:hypothetical protein